MTNRVDLPDFDELAGKTEAIRALTLQKLAKEIEIEDMEAQIVQKATTDPTYFLKGKMPSMAYIQKTYMYRGFNGELIPMRNQLAELVSALKYAELNFKLGMELIGVWRTQAASERQGSAPF